MVPPAAHSSRRVEVPRAPSSGQATVPGRRFIEALERPASALDSVAVGPRWARIKAVREDQAVDPGLPTAGPRSLARKAGQVVDPATADPRSLARKAGQAVVPGCPWDADPVVPETPLAFPMVGPHKEVIRGVRIAGLVVGPASWTTGPREGALAAVVREGRLIEALVVPETPLAFLMAGRRKAVAEKALAVGRGCPLKGGRDALPRSAVLDGLQALPRSRERHLGRVPGRLPPLPRRPTVHRGAGSSGWTLVLPLGKTVPPWAHQVRGDADPPPAARLGPPTT